MTRAVGQAMAGLLGCDKDAVPLAEANRRLRGITGVRDFFRSEEDRAGFARFAARRRAAPSAGKEWGDFQTPRGLADRVCGMLRSEGFRPDAVLEPTYGTGNFLLAALAAFPGVRSVYGVEIRREHEWAFKAALLEERAGAGGGPPDVRLFREDVFAHELGPAALPPGGSLLVIGNPPWATRAGLSSLGSANSPARSNRARLRGIDALTGRSNFDLGECVMARVLDALSRRRGRIAMLCKMTVVRNLVRGLPRSGYGLGNIRAMRLDARREFGRSVDAALLVADLGAGRPGLTCGVSRLGGPRGEERRLGWAGGRFVSDVGAYGRYGYADGASCLEWRSGIKHDCAPVLELAREGGALVNGLGERVDVEGDRLYPLVKGSALKGGVVRAAGRALLVTQERTSDGDGDLRRLPRTWGYLESHSARFEGRRSAVYRGRHRFSVFGVGPYSFAPYKVAICGMSRRPAFSLCPPVGGRPQVLDDTCYFAGFDGPGDALFAWAVLGSGAASGLLGSISFEGKRTYTKEVLRRVDVAAIAARLPFAEVRGALARAAPRLARGATERGYESFRRRAAAGRPAARRRPAGAGARRAARG